MEYTRRDKFWTRYMLVYTLFMTIINLRKLKWIVIRKRLLKLIALFLLFGSLNYIFDYILRPSKVDLVKEFSNALALAFGISFTDIIFLKREDN